MRTLLMSTLLSFSAAVANCALADGATDDNHFNLIDVFQLEFAADPQISPDGRRVVYVRNFMDIMQDRQRSNLWIVNTDGSGHRPLTTGNENDSSPRWSPDGSRLAYVSGADGSAQLYCRWMDSGQTAKLTNLTNAPAGLAWSPDGKSIAFSMLVPEKPEPFAELPPKPEGAQWAEPPKVIRKVLYRFDGQGYLKDGYHQIFVLSADGGTPRQLTSGQFHHHGPPAWTPDGKSLVFSANRTTEWEYRPRNSEIYELSIAGRGIKALTSRDGPDHSPVVSPDGKQIAYLGFEDRQQGFQSTKLWVMNRDGSNNRAIAESLDRDVESPVWNAKGNGLFFQYDDRGVTKIGFTTLDGNVQTLAENVGGVTLGRPYASGSFSATPAGQIAYTQCNPHHPADVAVVGAGKHSGPTTDLNADLLGYKQLGDVEEFCFDSEHDGRSIQAWLVKPPGFDSQKKYPLILEIHGGPFANYGPRFTAEIQLYAAAGYVVLYVNPRGSTSYGEEFGNLIHHAYPGHDYDDLMSGVDAVLKQGFIDERNLFVTGGSGGGILTAWIVGKTGRFRAAVAAKPVINWYSFALTADAYPFFYKYWFPGFPWEHPKQYLARSPLSLAGNVTTPTMLMTGEEDHRTPISEAEQFYQALKLRKVDTALVRIPGASHHIVQRPSNMMNKVAHILKWFEMYRKD